MKQKIPSKSTPNNECFLHCTILMRTHSRFFNKNEGGDMELWFQPELDIR